MTEPDRRKVREFARHIFGLYTGAALAYSIDIGHRTGLFTAAAAGPGTPADLAGRAGLDERYVREWLGAMVTLLGRTSTVWWTGSATAAGCLTTLSGRSSPR